MESLKYSFLPELGIPRRGKVREIYAKDNTLALVASDRISVFDVILPDLIPDKGRILTQLSLYWFDKTKDIIPSHLLSHPDPNVMIVKRCEPIKIEVIVRGYIVGSLWRHYQSGKRTKCGITLPEGLNQNDPLPTPMVTPTTKAEHGHDEDISEDEIFKRGLATKEVWNKVKAAALNLYKRGGELLKEKGMILVDTKYEFGLDPQDNVVLIDEIHTPDSSRFWYLSDYLRKDVKFPDKEFLREYLRGQGFTGSGTLPTLPKEIRDKVQSGYRDLYELITGNKLTQELYSTPKRVVQNLKRTQLIRGVFALIVAGSESDRPHLDKIKSVLKEHNIDSAIVIVSADKDPHLISDLIDQYNDSIEPLVCITVPGSDNVLSEMMAANLKWPVITCSPFKDDCDYLSKTHASLHMLSKMPTMREVDPENAALAAVRILKTMEQ